VALYYNNSYKKNCQLYQNDRTKLMPAKITFIDISTFNKNGVIRLSGHVDTGFIYD